MQSFKQKINFFEKLLVNINLGNYDFIRKLCWILSKLYLKLAQGFIDQGMIKDSYSAFLNSQHFFINYCEYTEKIKMNPILNSIKYLQKQPFLEKSSF